MLIVSMAEGHSLRLILSQWLGGGGGVGVGGDGVWGDALRIHELEPTTGTMRPFAFVLRASDGAGGGGGGGAMTAALHRRDGTEERIAPISEPDGDDGDAFLDAVAAALDRSRAAFLRESEERGRRRADGDDANLLLATVDVKPPDADVDLVGLHDRITSPSGWGGRFPSLRWYDGDDDDDRVDANGSDSGPTTRRLRYGRIVPVGYGIRKLALRCVADSDDLGGLAEAAAEAGGVGEGGAVMSVDVDWDGAVPVRGAGFLGRPPSP